ncbi:ribose-phosphate pyrophosphokinase [Candidatus Jorgensenbacteria bacterium]|nr:ribose-phosphate pyrophosphokinase [Candidatus Jorgensenbacteria bacterium]
MENTLIFSTAASLYFAKLLARHLGIGTREIETTVFGGGEIYYRLGLTDFTELFGRNVIFVGSTHSDLEIEELYRVGCSLAMYGAQRRIFVVPFFGYSTMERAKLPGEVVTAKIIARKFSSIPNTGFGNVFLFMDLHTPGLVHYFEGDCMRSELYAEPVLVRSIKEHCVNPKVFGSADLGRPAWVRRFAKHFGARLVFIDKEREGEKVRPTAVIGNVRGSTVFIYDDMLRSGDTLIQGAEAYLTHGAERTLGVVSHAAFNDEKAIAYIEESPIEKIITTNTHPMSQHPRIGSSDKFIVSDVSPIYAATIAKILGS